MTTLSELLSFYGNLSIQIEIIALISKVLAFIWHFMRTNWVPHARENLIWKYASFLQPALSNHFKQLFLQFSRSNPIITHSSQPQIRTKSLLPFIPCLCKFIEVLLSLLVAKSGSLKCSLFNYLPVLVKLKHISKSKFSRSCVNNFEGMRCHIKA